MLVHTILTNLGYAAIASIWQYAVLWLVYLLVSSGTSLARTPRQKYQWALWLQNTGFLLYWLTVLGIMDQPTQSISSWTISGNQVEINYWAGQAYLVAIGMAIFRFIWKEHDKKATRELQHPPAVWKLFMKDMSMKLGLKSVPVIYLSAHIKTPHLHGWWKPVIYFPMACLTHLSPEQCESLILHELEHIRRMDHWWNRWLLLVELLLCFNPFVYLLNRVLKNEREKACDDMVLQWKYDPYAYAQSLHWLASQEAVGSNQLAAIGHSRFELLHRIERMLTNGSQSGKQSGWLRWLYLPLIAWFLTDQPWSTTAVFSPDRPAAMQRTSSFFETVFKQDLHQKSSGSMGINPARMQQKGEQKPPLASQQNEEIVQQIEEPIFTQEHPVQYVATPLETIEYAIPVSVLPDANTNLAYQGRPFVQNSSLLYYTVHQQDSSQYLSERQRWEIGLQKMAALEDQLFMAANQFQQIEDSLMYIQAMAAERYIKTLWMQLQQIDLPVDWYQTNGYAALQYRYQSTLHYLAGRRLQYLHQFQEQ
jgi:hypothetical protein